MARRRPAKWLRILQRVFCALVAGCLVLFLLVQLVLATPWARGRVAEQVTKRTGLDCRISGLSWTPWGGVGIRSLVVDQPRGLGWNQPLLNFERLRVQPDYVSCLRREWAVRAVEIERPELSISLEMLAAMARRSGPTEHPPSLAVAEEPQPAGPVLPAGLDLDGGPVRDSFGGAVAPPSASPVAVPMGESERTRLTVVPAGLMVANGSIELFSGISGSSLFRLSGVQFSSTSKQSGLEGEGLIETLTVGEFAIETDVGIELDQVIDSFQLLLTINLEENKQPVCSLRVSLEKDFPFQATFSHHFASPFAIELPRIGALELASNQTLVYSRGWLLAPMTWQGLMRVGGRGLALEGLDLSFDRHHGTMILRNGLLQVPDARVLGDQVSLLGNGWLTRDAGAAVFRVVVPGQSAALVANRLGGGSLNVLKPGNQLYVDLHAWKESGSWVVEQGDVIRPADEFVRDVAAGVGWAEESLED